MSKTLFIAVVLICGAVTLLTGLAFSVLGMDMGLALGGTIADFHLKATAPAGLVFVGAVLQWTGVNYI